MKRGKQQGMTLIVALVMLIVLSLLVVSAIRFSNINLKIAGNVQTETESTAAVQVALETTIQTMMASSNLSTIAAQTDVPISTGGTSYKVSVSKPVCQFNRNVSTDELDPTRAADRACFESADTEKLVTSTGSLTTAPTACRDQLWDVSATVNDTSAGSSATILQGVAVRVGAEVACP